MSNRGKTEEEKIPPTLDSIVRLGMRSEAPGSANELSILSFEGAVPHRLPLPPTPHDRLDATRLVLRLRALAEALDDLPRQARRFLRWQALRARARARGLKSRISPLRGGRPPGQLCAGSRRPRHEIHEILRDLCFYAGRALDCPDTS